MRQGRKRGRGARIPEGALTTSTVAWLTGFHTLTLSRWITRGVIRPRNVGTRTWRVFAWSDKDIAVVYLASKLRKLGVPPKRVEVVAKALAKSGVDLADAVIFTDKKDIYLVVAPGESIDLTSSPGNLVCYPLGPWVTEISAKLEAVT